MASGKVAVCGRQNVYSQAARINRQNFVGTSSPRIPLTNTARKLRSTRQIQIVNTYPEPETEKERSPIDFPQVKMHFMAFERQIYLSKEILCF